MDCFNYSYLIMFSLLHLSLFLTFCFAEIWGTVKDCSESEYWHEEPFACIHDRSGFFECTWEQRSHAHDQVLVSERYFECPLGKVCWSQLYDKKAPDMCVDAPPKLIDVGFLSWYDERYRRSRTVSYKTKSGKYFQFEVNI